MLVFGVGFLAPLLLVLLNFAGVLSAKRLISWWRWIIFVVFLFAAVATPTGDPINLILLAGPMLILVGIAILVAYLNDKRRARRNPEQIDYDDLDDDEMSPLPPVLDADSVDATDGSPTDLRMEEGTDRR